MLVFVKRHSKELNLLATKTLYTLIRSHLEYVCVKPVFNIDILNIEKVQDQFYVSIEL